LSFLNISRAMISQALARLIVLLTATLPAMIAALRERARQHHFAVAAARTFRTESLLVVSCTTCHPSASRRNAAVVSWTSVSSV